MNVNELYSERVQKIIGPHENKQMILTKGVNKHTYKKETQCELCILTIAAAATNTLLE